MLESFDFNYSRDVRNNTIGRCAFIYSHPDDMKYIYDFSIDFNGKLKITKNQYTSSAINIGNHQTCVCCKSSDTSVQNSKHLKELHDFWKGQPFIVRSCNSCGYWQHYMFMDKNET